MDHPPATKTAPAGLLPPSTIILSGPTAVGKSAVALHLAEHCGAEIISADSMQVYRGLDIGTAKPTLEEQARVPHHLIDVVDLDAPFDVAQYLKLVTQALADLTRRGKIPLICGGTSFYIKALGEGIGAAPPSDPELRTRLEKTPLPDLLTELEKTDLPTYQSIDRQNPRRVVRAVEVIRLTGLPFSAQKSQWSEPSSALAARRGFVMTRSPEDLRARINGRVDKMFQEGLIEETRRLMPLGLHENQTARQAIGYRQVMEYLNGARSLPETIALVKSRTWKFARRQMTWFRHQLPLQILEIDKEEPATTTSTRIIAELGENIPSNPVL